jgi:succinylglutamate desuccinylase
LIGKYSGDKPGPLVLFVAGIHGNEPSGVEALERVFADLHASQPAFRGDVVGLAGNLSALARGQRFIEKDLNRQWDEDRVFRLRDSGPEGLTAEDAEQAELIAALEDALRGARGDVFFLDLHTTSAVSAPFLTISDTLRTREFALLFSLPLVLGLEERLHGALLEFFYARGFVALGVESGQHDDPASVDRHEWVAWTAMRAAGNLDATFELAEAAHERLAAAAADMRLAYEVLHRHGIEPEDRFAMEDGFHNFQRVSKGDVIGRDSNGPIRAPIAGRVFLPLYQKQGDDGFFIAREVRPVWLRLSAALRRLRADRIVSRLPGVNPHPSEADTYVVNQRVARWMVTELFHLLGFRRETGVNGETTFRRRKASIAADKRPMSS